MANQDTFEKYPEENKTINVDVSPILRSGLTIASITSVTESPNGLITLQNQAHDGNQTIQLKYSGGTQGDFVSVKNIFVDSLGDTQTGYIYINII